MKHKRYDSVPIANSSSDLGRSVKAVGEASPQALGHFTLSDQVDQLAWAGEEDPDLGFMARTMVLCSLPRSNPGNQLQYKRTNGPFTLGMIAGLGNKLPYGNLPRLLLAWVSTEAVRTQSRKLVLGRSLSEFMRTLGIYHNSGGRGGVQTRLRNQMKRLFGCSVSLIYKGENVNATVNAVIANHTVFWWNERKPDQPSLWDSKIELSEKFFNDIINHPVPIDMNTLTALKRSPLGLDLYLWLVYRTFSLKRPLRLSWANLYRQFGVDPSRANDNRTVQDFRKDCLRELKKVKIAWPELHYATAKGVLILSPSTPVIAPLNQGQLGR